MRTRSPGYVLMMGPNTGARTGLVPVHVGYERPSASPPAADAADDPRARMSRRSRGRGSGLVDPTIDWAAHAVEPRWLGMETSDCVAALDPSIFYSQGATELARFLAGAQARGEIALVVAMIGDVDDDDAPRPPFASADASISLPESQGLISGVRLPVGGRPSLVPDLSEADRDLGLRLLNRPPDAPWWSLRLGGFVLSPGGGGPDEHVEPGGQLRPILADGLGDPVAAAWTSVSGDQRWYVIPDGTDWSGVLAWLVERALPTHVPRALRRVRASQAVNPTLLSPAEADARRELNELDSNYAEARRRLESKLQAASGDAEPMRYGLLYGTGEELVAAVASALTAAGFAIVELDVLLRHTASADLLVTYEGERRLIEAKSASGSASESLVGYLERHLEAWPHLRPEEPVGGGILVVNHQHRLDPDERTQEVYARPEFVASLAIPVISTRRLFQWWRDSDWPAMREAVLGRSGRPGDPEVELRAKSETTPRWRGWPRRRER